MVEILLTTLATNLPSTLVFLLALYLLRDNGRKSKQFRLGLFLVLLSGLLAMPRFNERLQGDGGLRNGYRKRGRDVSAISAFDAASIVESCLPGTLECGRLQPA